MRSSFGKKSLVIGLICLLMLVAISGAGAIVDDATKFVSDVEYSPLSVTVTFTEPEKGIYLDKQKIMPFFVTLILRGSIEIWCEVEALPDEIDRVEYYMNGELCYVITIPPFDLGFTFVGEPFSRTTLSAVAYLSDGPTVRDKITIWKLFH